MNNMHLNIHFLGGIIKNNQFEYIHDNSIGNIQNAADVFQKKIIYGLENITQEELCIINLPFIGSYPKLFKSICSPASKESWLTRSKVINVWFLNIFGIKIFSRFISSLIALFKFIPFTKKSILFIYSAHIPFVLAALTYKFFNKNIKICLIVPDLPEYMGDGNFIYKFLKKIDAALFYLIIKKIHYFVLLTEHMAKKMRLLTSQYIIIEGIASSGEIYREHYNYPIETKYFLYSGTLSKRYGIANLIDAFSMLRHSDVELWICGNGDGLEYVLDAVKQNVRIKYLGLVPHAKSLFLQQHAYALVNPRQAIEEYTTYSFPSKIIEYMVAGRPIVMYKMKGVPDEYDPYYFSPADNSVEALSNCLINILSCNVDTLTEIGSLARKFILSNKNEIVQSKKILNFILEEPNVK
ncbi:MAG: glycosyltransferase [Polaromonas sp.]|nr:glycosyltransferase [Polaromonas sp.]